MKGPSRKYSKHILAVLPIVLFLFIGCHKTESQKKYLTIEGPVIKFISPKLIVRWYNLADKREKLISWEITDKTEIYSDGKILEKGNFKKNQVVIISGYKEKGKYIACRIELIPKAGRINLVPKDERKQRKQSTSNWNNNG